MTTGLLAATLPGSVTPMSLTLVYAEDAFIVREGVRAVIETVEDFELLDCVRDYFELLEAVARHRPDVAITDIRMPPTRSDEGIRAAREIRRQYGDIGVLVLSQYVEPEYALGLFEDGADGLGYLLKERVGDVQQLAESIRRVADGGSVIDPKVVDALVAGRAQRKNSKLARLTDREMEVLEQMATGRSNPAIADELYLSVRAIEKNVNAIFTKLDLFPEANVNRRVKAVLTFLSESAG